MNKNLVIFGPWCGEFCYELSWWIPEIRKQRLERYTNYDAFAVGFEGRKVLYKDFTEKYFAYTKELEDTLKYPATFGEHINGRDIMVERQTPAEAGNQYGKTTIRVKPNQTALTEDKAQLETLFETQSDITELYTEPTYDELKDALQNFLNPSDDDSTETTTTSNGVAASTAPTSNTGTTTETAEKKENVEDAFDQLFNS